MYGSMFGVTNPGEPATALQLKPSQRLGTRSYARLSRRATTPGEWQFHNVIGTARDGPVHAHIRISEVTR
jgi:hypothetical protein